MSVDVHLFRNLEEGLWREETRSDPGFLDELLTEDFSDFCRFGHVYDREDLIGSESSSAAEVEFPFEEFNVQMLAPTVVLVTYVNTVIKEGERQRARRSSVWVEQDGAWRLRHVQATTLN